MQKEFRVRSRNDFVRISKSGFYFRTDCIVAQCDRNNLDVFRVGFTASKRVGNAVVRNRCKRRIRAAAEIILKDIGLPGLDYVFIARKSAFDVEWLILLESMKNAVEFLNKKIFKCKRSL